MEEKRGPGRPRKEETAAAPKKGRKSWLRTADRLNVQNKDPNYHYRWVDKSNDAKIEIRKSLGYEFVNPSTGATGEAGTQDVTGAKRMGDLVLMALPMEDKLERDKEISELTDQQTAGLKSALQKDMSGGGVAKAEGKIIIE